MARLIKPGGKVIIQERLGVGLSPAGYGIYFGE